MPIKPELSLLLAEELPTSRELMFNSGVVSVVVELFCPLAIDSKAIITITEQIQTIALLDIPIMVTGLLENFGGQTLMAETSHLVLDPSVIPLLYRTQIEC